jgi:hypothetical protein
MFFANIIIQLKIFESETKRFSSQTYSTINEILPFHINSVKRLEEFKRKTRSGLIREACDAAIDKLEKYKCQLVDCDPIVFAMSNSFLLYLIYLFLFFRSSRPWS